MVIEPRRVVNGSLDAPPHVHTVIPATGPGPMNTKEDRMMISAFSVRGVFPPVNVFGKGDDYVVRLEIPGLSAENINVETEGNTLTVSGKRDTGAVATGNVYRRDRCNAGNLRTGARGNPLPRRDPSLDDPASGEVSSRDRDG